MAIEECKECGQDVSDAAEKCPHCGVDDPAAGLIGSVFDLVKSILSLIFWLACLWLIWTYFFSSADKLTTDAVEKPQVDINKVIRLAPKDHLNQFNGKYYKQLSITSLQDDVIIQDVVVNRGNCKIINIKMLDRFNTAPLLPLTLKFGKSFDFGFTSNCENILEAEVHTNKGNGRWTFN